MSTDPIVRAAAGLVLVIAFGGAMAVVAHGYWTDTAYQIPAVVSWVLGAGISSALTLLGVHLGTTNAQASVGQGARIVNGTSKPPAVQAAPETHQEAA